MPLTRQRNPGPEPTLESLFAARYPWLMRWALHFTHNDRAMAEDLVQETFVRILTLRDNFDRDNIEALLYTQLRFAYLTERRKNHVLQSLETVDFDTLAITLRTVSTLEQMQVQNDLRSVLEYLLWRRLAAKLASVFVLRFFHGLSVEEIAAGCRMTRNAVDLSLSHAREELKTYLADPKRVHVLGRGAAPEIRPYNRVLPSVEFADALIESIFARPCGRCASDAELERSQAPGQTQALDTTALAHIVSCRSCLHKIRQAGATPPAIFGESPDVWRRPPRRKSAGPSDKEILARIFTHGRERMREVIDHYPSELIVALNGEVVAVRDIHSSRAVLRIESRATEKLEMIEVFSEQGLLMLTLPVTQHPPIAPPELTSEVTLSGDRALRLSLRFAAEGVLIEALYTDPHFLEAEERSRIAADEALAQDEHRATGPSPKRRPLAAILDWLRIHPLVPATVLTLLFASLAFWQTSERQRSQREASALLSDSVSAERFHRIANGPGVVHQKVSVRSKGQLLQRDLYRDIDGHRHPRTQAADAAEQDLRQRVIAAGLDWNDPLSVAAFEAWRDHSAGEQDTVTHPSEGLLTITTTASAGPLWKESLTIRLSDFHPVERDLVYRDHDAIQIAELSYEVLPWSPASEKWFQPLSKPQPSPVTRSERDALAVRPVQVNENDLDVAQLSVLLAIQDLHADTERLDVERTPGNISVRGIVATDARKQEIGGRLRLIPHVIAEIRSYNDAASASSASATPTAIKAVQVSSEASPIDDDCTSQHLTQDRCRQLAYILLETSAALAREDSGLDDLERTYPDNRLLSSSARGLRAELMHVHMLHLLTAIREQQQALPALGVASGTAYAAAGQGSSEALDQAVQQNRLLTQELVYARGERPRSVLLILQDLADSAAAVQGAVSQLPVMLPSQPVPSSTDNSSAHQ